MSAREQIREAALALFDSNGLEATPVAAICRAADVSNGSFFHAFATKEALGADLFLTALAAYHAAMLAALADGPDAGSGIARLIGAHLDWVTGNRPQARFLFEHAKPEWLLHAADRQADENRTFEAGMRHWLDPLTADGELAAVDGEVFFAQLIGPAQMLCRGWLSGRSASDPRAAAPQLIAAARRALLVTPPAPAAPPKPRKTRSWWPRWLGFGR